MTANFVSTHIDSSLKALTGSDKNSLHCTNSMLVASVAQSMETTLPDVTLVQVLYHSFRCLAEMMYCVYCVGT